MRALESPNIDGLRSAVGWLELRNYLEADAELDEITPRLQAHPNVLKVRWRVYAKARKWDGRLDRRDMKTIAHSNETIPIGENTTSLPRWIRALPFANSCLAMLLVKNNGLSATNN